MKTLFLACAFALSIGTGAAFASVTIFTDGSTFDSAATAAKHDPSGARLGMSNTVTWHKTNGMKVVRFGPPETGSGAG